jgi:hypothetical protein
MAVFAENWRACLKKARFGRGYQAREGTSGASRNRQSPSVAVTIRAKLERQNVMAMPDEKRTLGSSVGNR